MTTLHEASGLSGELGQASHASARIVYETIGVPDGDPLLLIMGTGAQLTDWPDELCASLVRAGFSLARFDNRDAGLSTHLESTPPPGVLRTLLRPNDAAAYRLDDMAGDAVAVLDAVGWPAAHVVGISLGGMIAQTVAVRHPTRVLSLTSISSTPWWRIGRQRVSVGLRMARAAMRRVRDVDDAAAQAVAIARVVSSPGYAMDEAAVRARARRAYERRPFDVAGARRQNAAIAAAPDLRPALAGLRVPTLVMHGDADPVIRIEGGRATASAIPGARLLTFPGMGHDLPRQLWPAFVEAIRDVADRAARPV